jgi:hypothetical protein
MKQVVSSSMLDLLFACSLGMMEMIYSPKCQLTSTDYWSYRQKIEWFVRFEVFTTVTVKNGVFWDVTPRGSCKNRRFGGA